MNNGIGQVELAIVKGPSSGLFSLTDTGVNIAEDTDYDQWLEGLKMIKWARTKLSIGLADYISFGKRKFGDNQVESALQQLEFETTMVKTAIAVNSIPQELRFSNLTGEHYLELSRAETKPQQVKWARIASEQALTPVQLRLSMAEGEIVDKAATKALSSGVVTIHGIRQQFDVWINRVGGLEGVMKMEQDVIDEIRGELQSIVQFGLDLKEQVMKEA